ncbi:M20 metallopeptidase family protein [Thermovenabulum gondwanense]|uniref:Putative hydrolase YxeP n=1 Tax=Thermovenabulum gondwanense TaxID=520767 RepID=A0A161QCE0_9FIRM|nr:M20 family metallopeptidase [Thermovenabulum gondwanense]KYO66918.1 putative hydrolase YxeP [Thermovenabulum gondwanense]
MIKCKIIEDNLNKILPNIINLRKEIHQNPELGYQEYKTTGLIVEFLKNLGITVETKYSETGAVGLLKVPGAVKTLAIRADIDALPIQEETGAQFASKNDGVMHACGHDVHSAVVMGVANLLSNLKDYLKLNIKFIFQPAEECSPEGGAKLMIENGVLDDVDAILGLHVWPDLPVGTIGTILGNAMAASDRIKILIEGKSSHAAEPQNGIDSLFIAGQVINLISSFRAKYIDPYENVIMTIGSIQSEGRYNIVCPKIFMDGTIRTLSENTRVYIKEKLPVVITNLVKSFDGNCKVDIIKGYDVLKNDPVMTEKFVETSKEILGINNVLTDIRPTMISEDFSFYAKRIPAVYFFLGCESKIPLHSSRFLPNEKCIPVGIKAISNFVLNGNI